MHSRQIQNRVFTHRIAYSVFVQQQYVDDRTPNTPAGFSIHRARLGVTGSITDNLRVRILGGFVEPPQNNPQLLHAHMDYRINPLLTIRAGQFLLPFGIEGFEGIPLNPAIERSIAVRRLNTFRMFSDIGVQASGIYQELTMLLLS